MIARAVPRDFLRLTGREVCVIPSAIDMDIAWPRMAFLGWLALLDRISLTIGRKLCNQKKLGKVMEIRANHI